jgi:glucose uptake protein GlcU
MKKYIFLFFVFTVLAIIAAAAYSVIVGYNGKASEYHIDLIAIAIASIITGCFFVKDKERAPTQKEGMIYLVSIMIILMSASIAITIYSTKSLIDSGELVLTRELINKTIGYLVGAFIEDVLAIYLPFYFTCKLSARKYKS